MDKIILFQHKLTPKTIDDLVLKAFEKEVNVIEALYVIQDYNRELGEDEMNQIEDYIVDRIFGNKSNGVDMVSCEEAVKDDIDCGFNIVMDLKRLLDDCTIIKNIKWNTGDVSVPLPEEAVMYKAVGTEGRDEVDEFLFKLAKCEWEPADFDIVW